MSSSDLFGGHSKELELIPLPDAEVRFCQEFIPPEEAAEQFDALRQETPWKSSEIQIWGKRVMQPRLICWYGDPGATYRYSGVTHEPLPWTPLLLTLRERLASFLGSSFNSVLLNLYRDQNDGMGWHSDDEPELGNEPTIASLSLGEARQFLMRHRSGKNGRTVNISLTSGSLLVMSGPTQKHWTHSIKKETRRLEARINLTFRYIKVPTRTRTA